MSIEHLVEQGFLGPLELAFVQEMGVRGEVALFLGFLLHAYTLGHLCVRVEGSQVSPSLPWTADYAEQLVRGAQSLPQEICQPPGGRTPIVCDYHGYSLQRAWRLEQQTASDLARLMSAPFAPLSLPFSQEGLLPEQLSAVEQALSHPVSIITGGPGTGKSFVARRILETLSPAHRVAVAAPTGRAARHLQGTTLHRLLGLPAPWDGSSLPYDFILVDEASMIDAELMRRLLRALRSGTRLLLLGDHHQLPPVESGAPFSQLLGQVPTTVLGRSVRVKSALLAQFAQCIRDGDEEGLLACLGSEAVMLLPLRSLPLFHERLLSPFRQGPFGCDAVNKRLFQQQRRLWQPGEPLRVPILITANDPSCNLYNGDSVYLVRHDPERLTQRDYVELPQGRCSPWELPPFTLGHCLSVHKAQGSEFDEVGLLFPEGSELFGREILYTAVTRAKRKVTIYGSQETVCAALRRRGERLSGLSALYRWNRAHTQSAL